MRWVIAIVIAGVLWALSAMPWVDSANHVQIVEQLGLNFRTVLVQMGAIVLMFPIIDMLFLKPLREAMYERSQKIEETYSEIENLREQMNTTRNEYEQRIAKTEAEAREQIQSQIREAQNLRTQLMAEASAKADELVKKASEEIEAEKSRVMVALRSEVVNLTLAATEKILNENMNDDRNRRLVQEFINTVEVPR